MELERLLRQRATGDSLVLGGILGRCFVLRTSSTRENLRLLLGLLTPVSSSFAQLGEFDK